MMPLTASSVLRRLSGACRPAALFCALVLAALVRPSPASADIPCGNEDGFRYHRLWRDGGRLASTVNLLNAGTSFETGESSALLLDGVLYTQRQFKEVLRDEHDIGRAFTGFSFDSLPGNFVDGTRSLRIDFTGPWYVPGGKATGKVELAFDWFRIPTQGSVDISLWARAGNRPVGLYVTLAALDTVASEPMQYIDLDGHPGGAVHGTFILWPQQGWTRQSLRTPPLPPNRRYAIHLWLGTDTSLDYCVDEGSVLWLDAVQVSMVAPPPADTLRTYDPDTHGEEIFLSVRRRDDPGASWNNVFFSADEKRHIIGRIEAYQDRRWQSRGPGTVSWKLYAIDPAGGVPYAPIASGASPVGFASSPRRFLEVDLSAAGDRRLGVYKWIAEVAGSDGARSDRQELTYAVVRSRASAPGPAGNFGVDLCAAGVTADSTLGSAHHIFAQGRAPLETIMSLYSQLSFTQDRAFGLYDWACTHWAPGVEAWNGFYPQLAAEKGLAQVPVVGTVPAWWDGSDWSSWDDFMRDLVRKYGVPQPDSGAGVLTWNLFNEVNRYNVPYLPLDEYAGLLGHAADIIHATSPRSELTTTLQCNNVSWFLRDLLNFKLPDGRHVRNILDGAAMNAYQVCDTLTETTLAPEAECFIPRVPWGTWQLQATKFGVQLADSSAYTAVRRFPITETATPIGNLRADRASQTVVYPPPSYGGRDRFLDATSGSLEKARQGAERFIRYQLLNLALGGGPVDLFAPEPAMAFATSDQYGLFHPDHSPTALLAAQVQLNAEVGPAHLLRAVPPSDLFNGQGQPNANPDVRLIAFEDAGTYLLVGWSAGADATIRFDVSPANSHVTARDFQGNLSPVACSVGYFTRTLTSRPCYIRVTRTVSASDFLRAIDHRAPDAPVVERWSVADSIIGVRFRFTDGAEGMPSVPGDVDSLRFYYKPDGGPVWLEAGRFPVWSMPDSTRYTGIFHRTQVGVYWVKASAVESVTGRESFSPAVRISLLRDLDAHKTDETRLEYADSFTVAGPHPSRDTVRLTGTAAGPGHLRLTLYDLGGRRVRVVTQDVAKAGAFELAWDGRDDVGRRAPAGVYFMELERGGKDIGRQRLILVR